MPETQVTPSDGGLPAIPGYEMLEVLGKGGQGTVYRARQKSLNRVVAIKILAAEHATDRVKKRRFLAEARLQSKLHHPNILQGIDIDSHEGSWFFVMEFVSGRNVHELLREQGKLSEAEAVNIAQQVAEALSHAFERGIVHGDIKPENLVLSHDGTVKMVDFGVARLAREEKRRGPIMGTQEFMAPEVLNGKSTGDIRSDLFSVGVTMWEMVSGSLPPMAKSTPKEGPDIRQWEPAASKRCANLIATLLAEDPKHRYANPRALMTGLAQLTASAASAKQAPTTSLRTQGGSPKGVLIPVLAASAMIMAVFVLFLVFSGGDDPDPAPGESNPISHTAGTTQTNNPPKPGPVDPVEPTIPDPSPPDPVKPPPPDPETTHTAPKPPPGKPELVFDPPRLDVREGEKVSLKLTARHLGTDLQPLFKILDADGRDISAAHPMPKVDGSGHDPSTVSVSWTAPWFAGHAPTALYLLVSQPPAQQRLPVMIRDRNRTPDIMRKGAPRITVQEGKEPKTVVIEREDADGDTVSLEVVTAPASIEATLEGGRLMVRARDLPGIQGGAPERIVIRGSDGFGGTDICDLEVVVEDIDHLPKLEWDLADGPWTIAPPDDPSRTWVLLGPERTALNAKLRIIDPDIPNTPLITALEKSEDRATGISMKRGGDGSYRMTFRNPPGRGWGPTRARLLVGAQGEAQYKINLRIQVLRRTSPPPNSSKDPLDLALGWLRRHQLEDGSWPVLAAEFRLFSPDPKDGGAGKKEHRLGITALAVIAALRSGDGSPWVRKGVRYLTEVQGRDGCIGPQSGGPSWIYNHSIATEALVLAWHLLGHEEFATPARRAVHFLQDCRNRGPAGAWRYGVRPGDNDTSVTIWCMRALLAARMAGIPVDETALQGGFAWIRTMIGDRGRIGYQRPGQETVRSPSSRVRFLQKLSEALTAASLSILVHEPGFKGNDRKIRKSLGLVLDLPCAWSFRSRAGSRHAEKLNYVEKRNLTKHSMHDFYYWQHATALFRSWKVRLGRTVHRNSEWRAFGQFASLRQRKDGHARGSWDPTGAWCADTGRSYATAMMALAIANVDFMDAFAGEAE